MTGADLKARLLDWHSTLAGVLIVAISVVVALLFCHVITADQIVNCVDAATKILAMVAAVVSAIALMLTKSGNQDAAQVGEDMLTAAERIKDVAEVLGDGRAPAEPFESEGIGA